MAYVVFSALEADDSSGCAVGGGYWDMKDQDKRLSGHRKRVLLQGCVVSNDGSSSFKCSVKDITMCGARIFVPDGQIIQQHSYLIVVRQNMAHKTRIIWRKNNEVGLQFERSFLISKPPNPSLAFLSRIWAEQVPR